MRIERVAGPKALEVEIETVAAPDGRDVVDHRLRVLLATADLAGETLDLGDASIALGRGRRIELERMPDHGHVLPMREALEGGFETAFAHVAPRARDVGPDIDGELRFFHPLR